VVVDRIDPGVTCAPRLRELGIMEGMPLVVLRHSDPLVLLTEESRIAIDLHTADCIEVRIIVPAESFE
jgi:Fe2+ transport system protein FeoA